VSEDSAADAARAEAARAAVQVVAAVTTLIIMRHLSGPDALRTVTMWACRHMERACRGPSARLERAADRWACRYRDAAEGW
jgi:hypothetical protein